MGNLYQSDMTQEVILNLRIDKGEETDENYACLCGICGEAIYHGDTIGRNQSGIKICFKCFKESIDDMLETA